MRTGEPDSVLEAAVGSACFLLAFDESTMRYGSVDRFGASFTG